MEASPTIEQLLTHVDFVRGLCRSLLRDPDAAAHVESQTWLAALQRPPTGVARARGWLATVARNFARQFRRAEARRTRREQAVAVDERVLSVADVLARESVRQQVVEAVLALDEPYRDAVLLRYFEERSNREIAARLGVPESTVATWLQRALARLRTGLDGRHGGDRKAWMLAIVPLALTGAARDAAAEAGGAVMVTKVLAATAALGLGAYAIIALAGNDDPSEIDLRPAAEIARSGSGASSVGMTPSREPSSGGLPPLPLTNPATARTPTAGAPRSSAEKDGAGDPDAEKALAANQGDGDAEPAQKTITLDVKDANLVDVVKFIRSRTGRNILLGKNPEGKRLDEVWPPYTVTVQLEDVPWEQALGLVAGSAGLEVHSENDMWYVGE